MQIRDVSNKSKKAKEKKTFSKDVFCILEYSKSGKAKTRRTASSPKISRKNETNRGRHC